METSRRAWVRHLMGMPVSIHLRGTGTDAARQEAVAAAYAELAEVDRVFSTYRSDSDISRLRAGVMEVSGCAPEVAAVLDLCVEASRATDGYFSAWLPEADGVVRLDPSGLVKGWAVQRAARRLDLIDADDYYLSAGGDIALAVRDRDGEHRPWRVAIEDPHEPTERVAVIEVADGGVATSGTAHRGAHIVDPVAGRPATGLASVTVVGPSVLWADVLATAACARGVDALRWLDWPPGYHALAVTSAGQVMRSDGMVALLAQAGRRKQTSVDQRAKPSRW